ncbi:hypothetical protein [Flavobacterium sp.]|uniref:hypothetical protein n=1 Tax=Flavobacterium sp. TaxID=239 RepID=UPI00262F93B6|nr:hypothetical protein [Flavobacterium sp.]
MKNLFFTLTLLLVANTASPEEKKPSILKQHPCVIAFHNSVNWYETHGYTEEEYAPLVAAAFYRCMNL